MKPIVTLLTAVLACAGQPQLLCAAPTLSSTASFVTALAAPFATDSLSPQQAPQSDTASIARNYAIDDVVVKGKARRRHLGRRIESPFFSTSLQAAGEEAGIPCDAGKKIWRLGMFRIYCSAQQINTLVFRLRLYKMADKTVGEAIPIPEVLISLRDSTQFISADLSAHDIRVTGEFLLAVESVEFRANAPKGCLILNGRLGSRTFYRSKGESQWSTDLLGIGLSVEATPATSASGINMNEQTGTEHTDEY